MDKEEKSVPTGDVSRAEILEVLKLDYETTTQTVGQAGAAYSRFLLQAVIGIVAFFVSAVALGDSNSSAIVYAVVPYLSMLALAIENYVRTVLWLQNRYQFLLQERLNQFVGREVFLFGKYFRPIEFYKGARIVIVNVYRSFIPFLFFVVINLYSIIRVNRVRGELFYSSAFLFNYYLPITVFLLCVTTTVWLYFFITMVRRYELFMKNRLADLFEIDQINRCSPEGDK